VTVEIQERFVTTVVFEYFSAQIAVAGADFVGFCCHQSNENDKSYSISKTFSFSYCQFRKIIF
jgi:hypothetical protein